MELEPEGASEIASRSRGTPRIANRLLKRVRDYAEVRADGRVTLDTARDALALFEVDELGLDKVDRAILVALCRTFAGRAVGLGTLAVAVGEAPETVEDVYEPFLLQCGLLERTPRGPDGDRVGLRAPRVARPARAGRGSEPVLIAHDRRRPEHRGSAMPDEAATPDELVRYEVRDRVAHVTISNGKANALSPAVVAALDAALTRAEDAGEEQVGALLIAGAPGMLSGGFDLAVMRSGRGRGRPARDRRWRARSPVCFGSEVPVVIACSGHAVAAGALLLLGADAADRRPRERSASG